jgi:hypothetical protein
MTSAQVTSHFPRSPAYHLRKSGMGRAGVREVQIGALS